MPSKKILGLVLLVAGAIALYFGFQAAAVAGLALLLFTGKR